MLRTADRVPMSPRDLGGPALDPVVMRSRRQRPVSPSPSSAGPARRLRKPTPANTVAASTGSNSRLSSIRPCQFRHPTSIAAGGSSANSRARQTATPGDHLGLPTPGRACRHRRAPARTVPGQPRAGGGRPGGSRCACGRCWRPAARSAVKHRPADVVPQPLVVKYELANRLRELVTLPLALESPCALALAFRARQHVRP